MAIYDFNAALKPVEGPIEQYTRLQQLRSLANQQQIQQQQLANEKLQNQQGQIGLQHAQQQQKDDEAFRQAMSAPEFQGKTIGDVADALARQGNISASAWSAAKKADVEQRKQLADATEKEFANLKSGHDMTQQLYNNIMQMPDEQLAQNWPQIAQQVKAIPGNEKMQIDPSQPMTKQQLAQFGPFLSMGNAYFDQELARRESVTKAKTADVGLEKSELELRQLQQAGGTTAMQEARYRRILSDAAAKKPISADDLAFAKGYEASNAKSSSTVDSLGIKSTNVSRPSGLASVGVGGAGGGGRSTGGGNLSQGGQNIVDMIGSGRMPVDRMSMLIARDPRIVEAVAQKYPDFDGSKVRAYMETFKDFTSSRNGTTGAQLTAGDTALQHLARLKKINDENPIEVRIVGTKAYNAYQNLLGTIADELMTFYGEPKTNEAIASKKATLGALLNRNAAIEEQAKAMGVRFDNFRQKWANAAPSAAYEAQMPDISAQGKAARAALDPDYAAQYQQEKAAESNGAGRGTPQRGGFNWGNFGGVKH